MEKDMQIDEQPQWKLTQCFGDKSDVEDITEADIISSVEFDATGDYLATGDKGGRIVIFERHDSKSSCEYKFYTEFQSHEPEFDYLKSLEIEEKINKIKWCRRAGNNHLLLSTNDKTIKLWKVYERSLKLVHEASPTNHQPPLTTQTLALPKLVHHDTVIAATPKKVYANAHAYHINSISVNSDGETFISADDLRINLWNLGISDQSFNIVDIKPANMEDLTEVITTAEFHPQSCHIFMYGSSKGTIKLADMRESALCDQNVKVFEPHEDTSNKSFFYEIISSLSDIKFSTDGRYILSRDYLTLKLWDVNMDNKPVETFPIHDQLRSNLCDLYESDCIFDKFECAFSGNGNHIMTGSYSNRFHIYNREDQTRTILHADKNAFKTGRTSSVESASTSSYNKRNLKEMEEDSMDFNQKILHTSWHPKQDTIAVAATNNLFVFTQDQRTDTVEMRTD